MVFKMGPRYVPSNTVSSFCADFLAPKQIMPKLWHRKAAKNVVEIDPW